MPPSPSLLCLSVSNDVDTLRNNGVLRTGHEKLGNEAWTLDLFPQYRVSYLMPNWFTSCWLGGWKFHAWRTCEKGHLESWVGLYLLEVGQKAVPTPIRLLSKVGSPPVVIFPLPTEDLHPVDARAATQNLAPNNGNGAVIQTRLGNRADVERESWIDQAPEAA